MPEGLSDEERKAFQLQEDDLGPIYGSQWRNYNNEGCDQLQLAVDTLKTTCFVNQYKIDVFLNC